MFGALILAFRPFEYRHGFRISKLRRYALPHFVQSNTLVFHSRCLLSPFPFRPFVDVWYFSFPVSYSSSSSLKRCPLCIIMMNIIMDGCVMTPRIVLPQSAHLPRFVLLVPPSLVSLFSEVPVRDVEIVKGWRWLNCMDGAVADEDEDVEAWSSSSSSKDKDADAERESVLVTASVFEFILSCLCFGLGWISLCVGLLFGWWLLRLSVVDASVWMGSSGFVCLRSNGPSLSREKLGNAASQIPR